MYDIKKFQLGRNRYGTLFFSKKGIQAKFYVIAQLNEEYKPSFIVDIDKKINKCSNKDMSLFS